MWCHVRPYVPRRRRRRHRHKSAATSSTQACRQSPSFIRIVSVLCHAIMLSMPEPNRSVWHGLPARDELHARHTQPEFEAPSCMDVAMPELLGPSMSLPSAWEVQTVPPNPSPRRAATVAPSRIVRFSILTRRSAAKLAWTGVRWCNTRVFTSCLKLLKI